MSNEASALIGRKGQHIRIIAWGFAALLLALPAIAMQFTREVNWGPEDFTVMGLMIGGTGFLIEVAVRLSAHWAYRTGAFVALLGIFFLIWVNLAVGVIGSEDNQLNAMFAAVPLTAAVGTLLAGFAARGMRWALVATAVVQAGIGGAAWYHGYNILPFTAVMTGLWLFSASLFGRAARDQ